MEKANTAQFRKLLLAKADDLRKSAPASRNAIQVERNAELLEEVQLLAEREIALTALSRSSEIRALVEQAIERIDAGGFGVCQACEEPSNEPRMRAVPWARFCIACQERAEGFGHEKAADPALIAVESL